MGMAAMGMAAMGGQEETKTEASTVVAQMDRLPISLLSHRT
jgi:hypothetical protein